MRGIIGVILNFKSEFGLECEKESDLLMEKGPTDANGCKMKLSSKKVEDPTNVQEDDSESSLLLPSQKGRRLKVQWNDKNGDRLAEILEFEPSEKSDSDEEDSDVCICTNSLASVIRSTPITLRHLLLAVFIV